MVFPLGISRSFEFALHIVGALDASCPAVLPERAVLVRKHFLMFLMQCVLLGNDSNEDPLLCAVRLLFSLTSLLW